MPKSKASKVLRRVREMTILCSPKATQHHSHVKGALPAGNAVFANGQGTCEPAWPALGWLVVLIAARMSSRKLSTLRDCGADDATANPHAFGVDDIARRLSCPAANRVLRVGHSKRAQMGHSCRAPRRRAAASSRLLCPRWAPA